jgi:hypothetical protein
VLPNRSFLLKNHNFGLRAVLQELVSGGKAYNASTDDMDALFAQARYRYQLQLEKQKDNDKLGVGILRGLFQPDGARCMAARRRNSTQSLVCDLIKYVCFEKL